MTISTSTITFASDDGAYLDWLRQHPHGFILNTTRNPKPEYMVLHRAACASISIYTRNARPGGFTERQYIKVCSPTIAGLQAWVRQHGRADGSFSSGCPLCDPQ